MDRKPPLGGPIGLSLLLGGFCMCRDDDVPPILLAQACDRHPVMLAYVLVSFVLTICCYFANTLSREKAEEWKAEWSRRQTLREA